MWWDLFLCIRYSTHPIFCSIGIKHSVIPVGDCSGSELVAGEGEPFMHGSSTLLVYIGLLILPLIHQRGGGISSAFCRDCSMFECVTMLTDSILDLLFWLYFTGGIGYQFLEGSGMYKNKQVHFYL